MSGFLPMQGRLAELVAGEATGTNDVSENAELDCLLSESVAVDREQMMAAASVVQLALLRQDRAARVALPESVRAKLVRQADAWNAGRQVSGAASVADLAGARQRRAEKSRVLTQARGKIRPSGSAALGWYLAAALAVAFVVYRQDSSVDPAPDMASVAVAIEARREALVSQAPDLVRVPWSASAEPGYEQARGDVVWSSSRQEGYLRLSGLPINDVRRGQYQLWVVDAERDVHPVDGGVFDVTRDGELIIPIDTTLPVNRPAAFAVTFEQPGGVVVSDGPMLLVAPVGS
ncbi:MAG: anti-sigma factor [Chromatiales bacterium]|jgi:anti-sigma-K factor RskA|nr:MAG: anti-sigma factor [Chromatiales bacterium]